MVRGWLKSHESHWASRLESLQNPQVLDSPLRPLQNRFTNHIFFCLASLLHGGFSLLPTIQSCLTSILKAALLAPHSL